MTTVENISIIDNYNIPKDISVLIRPMHINDVRTIYEIQKEMFPGDELYEEYEAFKAKFLVYPQGCFCFDLILDNEDSEDIKFFKSYEPSDNLELNKKKLLGHFFSHPWFKDEFPPLNNPKAVKEGVSKIINSETGEFIQGCGDIMLYLNEIAVRPRVKGYNLARIITKRILHHLYQNNQIFDHMGLVSVQGSSKVWSSIGFNIDTQLPEHKKNYLIKYYGDKAYYMKMKYTLSDIYINNIKSQQQDQNNSIINQNKVFSNGKLFKEIKKVSKL